MLTGDFEKKNFIVAQGAADEARDRMETGQESRTHFFCFLHFMTLQPVFKCYNEVKLIY